MREQDTGVISEHYYLSNCINVQGEITNVYLKKEWTQERALKNPMLDNFPVQTEIVCLGRFQYYSLFPIY